MPSVYRFLLLSLIHLLCLPLAFGQIELEDREIQGTIGFTNTVLSVPDIANGQIGAQSVGLPASFDNLGPVFGGTPLQRDYSVVVQAYDGGSYWLTSLLDVGPQRYRFGYAANVFASPGYPNFINDVYLPFTTPATPASPDPITPVDVLECAGQIRIHFIESDGAGGFVPATRLGTTIVEAFPRQDPADAAAPFAYRVNDIGLTSGGAQARRDVAPEAQLADLFVRSSAQDSGPDVRYQLRVQWRASSNQQNPECPDDPPTFMEDISYFEGVEAVFGGLGAGGVATADGDNPGIFVTCDEAQDVYVVLPDFPNGCVGDTPIGFYEGCVNLIDEAETFHSSRTYIVDFPVGFDIVFEPSIDNTGESPVPLSDLFDNFIPDNSEGFYFIETPSNATHQLRTNMAMRPQDGTPLNFFQSPVVYPPAPPEGGTVTGPDFCMVPGIYTGTVTLRDAAIGGLPSGATKDLVRPSSYIIALGPVAGFGQRDFRPGSYDAPSGVYTIPYENVFGNPENTTETWTQPRILDRFFNPSDDITEFADGGSKIDFSQPNGLISFAPFDYIAPSAGGSFTGPLVPGTQISERPPRTFPVDYEICYSTLRIQVDSQTVSFFDPRISTTYTGSFQDDRGTPQPEDDMNYSVFRRFGIDWLGLPNSEATATTTGFVNMHLPQGQYTDIGGFITTVFGPGLYGETELPTIDLALGCGESCTATGNAILCLTPIAVCNDANVVATDTIDVAGTVSHNLEIVSGFYRIGDGPEVPIDLTAVGIDCGPAPCEDEFSISVSGFQPCRNRIDITFVDVDGNEISAFLSTTLDTTGPVYLVDPSIDPDTPPYTCGTELHYSPTGNCDNVPASAVPLPDLVDNCSSVDDPDSPLIATDDSPSFFPVGTTVVELSAVDSCGNAAVCEIPVVIEDTTPPTVVCDEAGITLNADDTCMASPTISASATDNCDSGSELTVTHQVTLADGSTSSGVGLDVAVDFPPGMHTVSYEVTDSNGNTTTCTAPVEVVDAAPPVLECPSTALECPATETISATATDNCTAGSELMITYQVNLADGSTSNGDGLDVTVDFPFGLHSVTYEVTDSQGNTATCTAPVEVVDDAPPVLECPSTALECPATETISATATDNCTVGSELMITYQVNLADGSTSNGDGLDVTVDFPFGLHSVTYEVTDSQGNTATCTAPVEVVDDAPPVLECPFTELGAGGAGGNGNEWDDGITLLLDGTSPNVELGWTGGAGPYVGYYMVSTPPGVDPMITVNGTTMFSGEFFNVFDQALLNDGIDYFYRIFSPGGVGTFECEGPEGANVSVIAETSDNCVVDSVSNTQTGDTLDASDLYPLGSTPVEFTSIDTAGNQTECTSIVEIVDTTPPDITCPDPITLVRSDPDGAPSTDPEIEAWLASVTASDLCGPVSLENDSPAIFGNGPANGTTVTFTATDEQGLSSSCTSSVTILIPECGDGVVDPPEECDDGPDNSNDPGACRPDCMLPECGDGIQDPGEECDLGAGNSDDPGSLCSSTCTIPPCEIIVDKTCLVETPPPTTGDACEIGKPISLVFEYTGEDCLATTNQQEGRLECDGDPAEAEPIEIVMTRDADEIDVDPDTETINIGDTFRISRSDGDNFSSETELDIRQGGNTLQSLNIHTSCSKELAVGDQFGSLIVREFVAEDGTVIGMPEVDPTTPTDDCTITGSNQGCEGKVKVLGLRYIGGDCDQTTNGQSGRAECEGDAGTTEPVQIVITNDEDDYDVDPGGEALMIGDIVTLTATDDDLPSNTEFDIRHGGGTVQSLVIHTSCSKPLRIGDVFGSMQVVLIDSTDGGLDQSGANVTFFYEITNLSPVDVTGVTVEDNVLGTIDGSPIPSIPAGTSLTLEATDFISETTTNTVTVTGQSIGGMCDSTNSSTVTLVDPPQPEGSCEIGKPTALVFEYTGENCDATTNYQEGRFECDGDPALADPIRVVMTKDEDKITVDPSAQIIMIGDTVTISRTDGSTFASETMFDIRQGNNTLQSLNVHTSCSKPLAVGDQFGSMILKVFIPEGE